MAAPSTSEQTLASALARSEPLSGLLQRVRESRARLQAIEALLPATLRGAVRSGPLDELSWILLVPNAAAAAKLRQLLPTLQQGLADSGYAKPPLRIQVLPKS